MTNVLTKLLEIIQTNPFPYALNSIERNLQQQRLKCSYVLTPNLQYTADDYCTVHMTENLLIMFVYLSDSKKFIKQLLQFIVYIKSNVLIVKLSIMLLM